MARPICDTSPPRVALGANYIPLNSTVAALVRRRSLFEIRGLFCPRRANCSRRSGPGPGEFGSGSIRWSGWRRRRPLRAHLLERLQVVPRWRAAAAARARTTLAMNAACRITGAPPPPGGGGMNTVEEVGHCRADKDDREERIDRSAWQSRPSRMAVDSHCGPDGEDS